MMGFVGSILTALLRGFPKEMEELLGDTAKLRANLQAHPEVDDSATSAEAKAAAEDLGEPI